MKRIVLIATTAAVLIAAAAAFAATAPVNTYKATYSFKPSKAGSAKKPSKTSFKQNIQVTPGTSGDRAGVLSKIVTTIYSLKVDGKHFPTCSAAKIQAAANDTSCPKGALVATGAIKAVLGPATDASTSAPGGSCNPLLHVWNAGQGKLTFFFVDTTSGPHACLNGTSQCATFNVAGADGQLATLEALSGTAQTIAVGAVGHIRRQLGRQLGRRGIAVDRRFDQLRLVRCG